jgi:hypothetical protein
MMIVTASILCSCEKQSVESLSQRNDDLHDGVGNVADGDVHSAMGVLR